ncbi:MAG: M14 family zinc carboxypeptidase, partial [Phycisphaerales bacterium]
MRPTRCATCLVATFVLACLASPVVADDAAPIDPGPLAPIGYPTPEQTAERLAELAKLAPGRASVARIAVARSGPAVNALILGNQDFTRKLPAMLVVAGMDGVNLGSTEQCLTAVERVLRDSPAVLDAVRIYVIPEANPDARMHAITRREPRATNSRAVDDDRDGRVDEDGPSDLNGDGFVGTVWRVAPAGVKATHIVDPVDARIVRPANREKGEIATIEILREAIDLDQDGFFGEDGRGGVDLDRNFPHRWPEFAADAGPFPLSEPESLGIAKFVRDHPEIVTAVV